MSSITKFEDIVAWQKARELTREIYGHAKVGPFAKDFGLRDQIQRASVSIMGKVAEGFDRGGDKEFIQFLSIAIGSCGEVKSHLYVALDQQYVTPAQFTRLYERVSRHCHPFSPSPPSMEKRAGVRRPIVSSLEPLTPTLSPLGRGEGVGDHVKTRPLCDRAGFFPVSWAA